MKRFEILLAAVSAAVLLLSNVQATADPSTQLKWGSEVNPGQCTGTGKLVINVNQKIVNDIDSSACGGNWAQDEENRSIQVFQVDADTFCANVRYMGSWVTLAGNSPGTQPSCTTIDEGIEGTFQGGYRATITGSLRETPLMDWKTKGSLGTVDYQCNVSSSCPGAVNWVQQYFEDGWVFSYAWWGWTYHGGSNGTWVNSVDGNEGNITN